MQQIPGHLCICTEPAFLVFYLIHLFPLTVFGMYVSCATGIVLVMIFIRFLKINYMKNVFRFFFILLFTTIFSATYAQSDKTVGQKIGTGAKKTGHAVKKGGKAVGHKTAEVASKGKAKVVHTKYKDKVGPNGETIYIDKHSKYYWIDKKGQKHYVSANALKNPHLD